MKIQTLGIAVLGMVLLNSCGIFTKEVERRGPVYTETVETGPVYRETPILTYQVDADGNVMLDGNGDSIEVPTGKVWKEEIPPYYLTPNFYYGDRDGDGIKEKIYTGTFDTTWNYDRANSSGNLPDIVISSTRNTPACSSTSNTQTIIYSNTVPVNPPLRPYRSNARSYYGILYPPSLWWLLPW